MQSNFVVSLVPFSLMKKRRKNHPSTLTQGKRQTELVRRNNSATKRALLNPPDRRGAFVVAFVMRLGHLLSQTQSLPCPPASLLRKIAFSHCRMDEDHTASSVISDEELSSAET
jgi:hypothetical protein